MKILFFARRFYPQIGGVEKHVREIGKRLVKMGHKVIVIAELEQNTNGKNYHSPSKSATMRGSIDGIEIYRINAGRNDWFKKFRIWSKLWGLRKLITQSDLVHCHDILFWYLPFRFIYPTKKVYTTFHGYEGNKIPSFRAVLMHKIAEKLSKGNICVGDFLKKWYGTKPTFVTYGAVDIPVVERQNKTNTKLAIFVGRLEEETGIMGYLEALKIVSKKNSGIKLEVLGDGSLMSKAKRYSKQNKLNVVFRGFVADVMPYLKGASFVFVSRYLGILEAMVSKKYVLAVFNNKIKEDYLKMTPFANYISISSDSNEISKSLFKILSNQDKKNMQVDAAYQWVKKQTWENLTDLYLKLWS